jgi:hypothetical protein
MFCADDGGGGGMLLVLLLLFDDDDDDDDDDGNDADVILQCVYTCMCCNHVVAPKEIFGDG